MGGEVSYEQLVKEVCSDCWLYTEKNPKNVQEDIDCRKCNEKLKEGIIDMKIVGRYSKIPELRSNEITTWDWVLRPPRKFGKHGLREIDYSIYAKLRRKIIK